MEIVVATLQNRAGMGEGQLADDFMTKASKARALAAKGKTVKEIQTALTMTRFEVEGALKRSGQPGRPPKGNPNEIRVRLPDDVLVRLNLEVQKREGSATRNDVLAEVLRKAFGIRR